MLEVVSQWQPLGPPLNHHNSSFRLDPGASEHSILGDHCFGTAAVVFGPLASATQMAWFDRVLLPAAVVDDAFD